jgi:NTP pyrophosphatase (non-canonical NTP hydrolase)
MLDLNNMNEEEMCICEGVDALVELCHDKALQGHWWHDIETGKPLNRNVGEMLMLIVTEISEAMEAHRKNLMDDKLPHRKGIEVELADAVIRIADLAGGLDLDLSGAILEKIEYNSNRADHKVENRRKDGGKKC